MLEDYKKKEEGEMGASAIRARVPKPDPHRFFKPFGFNIMLGGNPRENACPVIRIEQNGGRRPNPVMIQCNKK
jgi:hypothetical protein